MNRPKLRDHPRWALYCKTRRAIARELEAEWRRRGLVQSVTADDVDAYLENNIGKVLDDVNCLFWDDLVANTRFVKDQGALRRAEAIH